MTVGSGNVGLQRGGGEGVAAVRGPSRGGVQGGISGAL